MNPAGKPKGTQNRTTVEFKSAVKHLIDFATPQMVGWLEKIAQESPEKALEMVYKFAQFGYPLLARSEIKHEGDQKLILQVVTGLPDSTPLKLDANQKLIDVEYKEVQEAKTE